MSDASDVEDANQAAFRVVREATADNEGVNKPENDDRCTYVWQGKRCILKAGHLETHQFHW